MINGIEGFYYLTERIIMSPFPGGELRNSEEEDSGEAEGSGLIEEIA